MFKLVKIPSMFDPFLMKFEDLFTKPSYGTFCDIVAAISVCNKSKTVDNLHDSMANDRKGKKARSSYNWFFTDAKWDENDVAQRKADLLFEALSLKNNDRVLLIIDDTYNEKKGTHTDGTGKFFDHNKGYIWGNNFVTSVLQAKGLFIPHKAKMYVRKDDAGNEFRTKPQIAFQDIIEPLKIPTGIKRMIVFDSWWFSADLINKSRKLEYHVTCRIKSDKIVIPEDSDALRVQSFAKQFEKDSYSKKKIKVRGKKKVYYVVEQLVELGKIGSVKLIISKKEHDNDPNYYICTDVCLTAEEILSIYEDRWDIETGHREANQKLGFKDYQLRDKQAIERFIQVVFSVWTALLLIELENPSTAADSTPKTLGQMVDRARAESIVDLIKDVMEYFNIPTPDGGLLYKLRNIGLET